MATQALIGVVGFSPLLDAFPLGPRLTARLRPAAHEGTAVQVENMTWSPIHIVQRFQDQSLATDRLVLVGAADACTEPGRITCHHWQGGSMPPEALQDRVYEAVTGIVCLDNTLMIGEHFGVWPRDVFTIELEMLPNSFGEIVMAEAEGTADRAALLVRLGFDPLSAGEQLARYALSCALDGVDAEVDLRTKSAATLLQHVSFSRIEVVAESCAGGRP